MRARTALLLLLVAAVPTISLAFFIQNGNAKDGFLNGVMAERSSIRIIAQDPGQEVNVTISTNPPNRYVIVDGAYYLAPQTFKWEVGSVHSLDVESPQPSGQFVQYVFVNWSDGGAQAHDYTVPSSNDVVVANFKTQYMLLTMPLPLHVGVAPNGSGWYDEGSVAYASVSHDVIPDVEGQRWKFSHWAGDASGTGLTSDPIVMDGPKIAVAVWDYQYYLAIDDGGLGVATGEGWYNIYSVANFSVPEVVVRDGVRYRFKAWYLTTFFSHELYSTEPSGSIEMRWPATLTVEWSKEYYLRVDSPYSTTFGEGWYEENAIAFAGVAEGFIEGADFRHVFVQWGGDASGTGLTSDPIVMDGPKIAVAQWKTQYRVAFAQAGLDASASGQVLTINATGYEFKDLPLDCWFDSGAQLFYAYETTVASSIAGKRFVLSGVSGPTSPITVAAPIMVTGNYGVQWLVTFSQTGLDSTASGTVVTVNGNAKSYADLPYSFWVNDGAQVTYSYSSIVSSSASGKRFSLAGVSGPASPVIVTSAATVTGNYATQWLVTFTQTGLDSSAIGTVVIVDGVDLTYGDLPCLKWVNSGATVAYAYAAIISSSAEGKRFALSGVTGPASPVTVGSSATINGDYSVQWQVIFKQTGLDSSAFGSVLIINGSAKGYADLPYAVWVNNGSTVRFEYCSQVASTVPGKRFVLTDVISSVQEYSPVSQVRHFGTTTQTVNGLTGYSLETTPGGSGSAVLLEAIDPLGLTVKWGIRVWRRTIAGEELEITQGLPVAVVSRSAAGEGMQSATWNCPAVALAPTDVVVIRVYVWFDGVGWVSGGTFLSERLWAVQLQQSTWTVYYYTKEEIRAVVCRSGSGELDPVVRVRAFLYFGDQAHDSRVTGFKLLTRSVPPTQTVTSPITITGNYKTQYRLLITVNALGGCGTTNPSPGTYWYDAGTRVKVFARAGVRGYFCGWYLDGSYAGRANPITVTMNAPHVLEARFIFVEPIEPPEPYPLPDP